MDNTSIVYRLHPGGEDIRQQGFSLIELLIVIMLIGIIGLIVQPQFSSMVSKTRLNEAAGELVSGLQFAANLAVTHQRPFGVKASAVENWFRVFDEQYKLDPNPHHNGDPPVDAYGVVLNPFDKKWYEKDFNTMGNYVGVKIASAPAGDETLFYPDGHSGITDSTYVLECAGKQKTIKIDGFTGRIWVN
jgi:prepilin-type N-terminal cleavage/methylation domain-containing protein